MNRKELEDWCTEAAYVFDHLTEASPDASTAVINCSDEVTGGGYIIQIVRLPKPMPAADLRKILGMPTGPDLKLVPKDE